MNLNKYVLFIAAFIFSAHVSADKLPSEIVGMIKHLDQDFGSTTFYGISAKRSISSRFLVGVDIMLPSETENDHFQTGVSVEEHAGLYFSFRSIVTENLFYELSLKGGVAMTKEVETGDDYAGICNCPHGFVEPTIHLYYKVTSDFRIGGLGGVFVLFSESERIYVSGIEGVLSF